MGTNSTKEDQMSAIDAQTGYAPVGDLSMYYEIRGRRTPLILLHGAYWLPAMIPPFLDAPMPEGS
jgi:hypothetical protein